MPNLAPHAVLERELALINRRRAGAPTTSGTPANPVPPRPQPQPPGEPGTERVVLTEAHRTSSFGLCFSGGGIRSATFNLGVLQGLCEQGLLKHVDLLSTVSGGGYIGSWLHGLIRNHDGGDPAKTERRLRDSVESPPGPPDEDPITFLRAYSNYLAPRPGLFSADTWSIALIWIRNVLLNQLILAPALAALVAAALTGLYLRQHSPDVAWSIAAVVGGLALAAATWLLVRNLRPIAKQSTEIDGGPADGAEPPEGAANREGVWIVVLVLAAAVALGTWPFATDPGWLTSVGPLALDLRLAIVGVGASLLMMLLQWGGGFVACYTAQHGSRWLGCLHVVWMSVVAGAVATAFLAGANHTIANWATAPWHMVTFGPPLMLGAILLSVMLLIGLMGADYPDAAREWTARIGSRLAIAAAAWTTLTALAILGPWGLTWLLAEFRTLGVSVIGAWALTALSGVLAGGSSKTNGKSSESVGGRVLGTVASVAPTVFLVGYLAIVATGVHGLVDAFVPPTLRPPTPVAARRYDVDVKTPGGAGIEVRVAENDPGFLADLLAPVDAFERGYPSRLTEVATADAAPYRLYVALAWFGLLVVVALVTSARVNINEFSLHHFYKNRLVRCYLGASNGTRRANGLTGFDPRDDFPLSFLTPDTTRPDGRTKPAYYGPYPIVNTAVNLNTGSELAQQERKASSFAFTPTSCGFDPSTREHLGMTPDEEPSPLGYRDTWGYGYPHGPSLGTAFAISGAAANPNWGYHTSGPIAFLLTVFNARLGWWLGNPRWSKPSTTAGPTLALRYLFTELLGQTTKRTKYVNLSDGGHFENLGLYELVRRRARFIIVCDAEEDGGLTFGSLGGVVRKCRADFGVEIDIDPEPIRRRDSGFSGTHCVVGTITYPEDETAFAAGLTGGLGPLNDTSTRRARGWLLYLKSSLTGDEPADVTEYHSQHAEFPHESTGDQFFSESQFESYRRLGLHVLRSAFDGVDVDVSGRTIPTGADAALNSRYPLVGLFQALTRRWYAPIAVSADAATRLANAYVETMRRLMSSEGLEALYKELIEPVPPPKSQKTPEMVVFSMELLQLMQNVYTEFRLEGAFNQANPRNSGWIQVFYKWLQSDLLYNQIWPDLRNDYHALFRQFVDDLRRHGVPDVPLRP